MDYNTSSINSRNTSSGGGGMNVSLDDLLSAADFDAVKFINARFPDEQSLEDLDRFVVGITARIGAVDEEISRAVQSQSRAGEQASKDIQEAQVAIMELFANISSIKTQASQSERMVQEICADIKRLDYAKTHLQTTITSLKRLQMLITAVTQLEMMASGYQYREVANLMEAVKQLMSHFDKYTSIPKVAEMKARVGVIQADLKKHVHGVFREIGKMVETVADADSLVAELPGNLKSLMDPCLVIDSLGAVARKDLLDEFVEQQMQPYENIFGVGKPHFGLEQVERRWAWIKRLVRNVDSKFGNICPKHWRLSHRLCVSFIDRTKVHFIQMLTGSEQNTDVTLLLKTLQGTLRFEQEMKARFEEDANEVLQSQKKRDEAASNPSSPTAPAQLQPGASIRKILAATTPVFTSLDPDESIYREEDALVLRLVAPNVLSSVFDQFLGGYVVMERKNLDEMLQKILQEDDVTRVSADSGGSSNASVFNSSMNMFVFIKNSIKRCTALTNGTTFLSLSREFRTCMMNYAEALRAKCPLPYSNGPPPVYRLAPGVETTLCYIVNTCEYCSEVVPQLEALVQSKIAPALSSQVEMAAEGDHYMDVVAQCIRALVSHVLDKMEPSFRTMNNTNWANVASVGEESAHIQQMNVFLQDFMPKIRENLSPIYFRNFCTKLATELLQKYLDTILRQKRISDVGAQQLLLDTYNVKSMLLHLHHSGAASSSSGGEPQAGSSASIPAMYLKLVTSRMSHIEMILKMMGLPDDLVVDRFRTLWQDGTVADLQNVLSLRGLKRPDQQQPFIDHFNASSTGASGSAGDASRRPPVSGGGYGAGSSQPSYGSSSSSSSSTVTSMASSMRSLTQDISFSARSAVDDLRKVVAGK